MQTEPTYQYGLLLATKFDGTDVSLHMEQEAYATLEAALDGAGTYHRDDALAIIRTDVETGATLTVHARKELDAIFDRWDRAAWAERVNERRFGSYEAQVRRSVQ